MTKDGWDEFLALVGDHVPSKYQAELTQLFREGKREVLVNRLGVCCGNPVALCYLGEESPDKTWRQIYAEWKAQG